MIRKLYLNQLARLILFIIRDADEVHPFIAQMVLAAQSKASHELGAHEVRLHAFVRERQTRRSRVAKERWSGTVFSYHTGNATKHTVAVGLAFSRPTVDMYEWHESGWINVSVNDPLAIAILTGWAMATETVCDGLRIASRLPA